MANTMATSYQLGLCRAEGDTFPLCRTKLRVPADKSVYS